MSLNSSEKINNYTYSMDISVDKDTWQAAINKVYNQQKKSISLPGFRKGKATRGMIERFYGKEVFYNDAFEVIFPDAVEAAVEEIGVELVDNPYDVDFTEVTEDGVTFTLKITVKPDVELDEYKGLKVERPSDEVTDADVDAEIKSLQERGARFVEVEREAKNDDMVTIDFDGYVDDKQFEGGKADGYQLTLGSGTFIPGFEDQICGHKAGDEFDVNVTFPEDYVEELAGKDATFKVKLDNVKEKQLPEIDDDLAMDVSEYDTLAELREHTAEDLKKTKAEAADKAVEADLYNQVAGLVKSEIPDCMIEQQIDESINEFGYQMQAQGLDLDTYLQYTGTTKEMLRENFKDRAESQVKCRLALEKIAELEKIEVSDEDIEKQYAELADEYKMEVDQLKKFISSDDLAKDIKTSKAMNTVKDAAEISAPKKKAAKKPAAKKTTAKKAADDTAAEEKPAKKTAAKKTTAKNTTAKKAADDKAAEEKPAAKKTAAKKPAAKKTTAKKASDKAAEEKPAAKKTAAKKTTAKKTAAKKEEKAAE